MGISLFLKDDIIEKMNKFMGKRYFFALFLLLLLGSSFFLSVSSSQAALQDSDFDNLTDESEKNIYGTDPNVFDTDGDGVGDGEEVVSGTNPLDPQSSHIVELARPDPGIFGKQSQRVWYFARATGIFAFLLLSFVTIYGLVMSSQAFRKIIPGAVAFEIHRTLAFMALGSVVLHIASFFFDEYFSMTLAEAFVPGVLKRTYTSVLGYDMRVAVALGIAGLYFMLLLILTSHFRSRISPKTWRTTHYISFIAYLAFVAHGITAGTDSKELWMQILYAVSFSIVMVLILVRIISRNILLPWRIKRLSRVADSPIDIPA